MDSGVGFRSPLFFIGVVENNEDRRLEGRVQVRAFGIHGTVDDIPTEDLPWATLVIGSHDTNFVVPPLNAWVFGCFLDGRDAQQPMILGLIPTQMTEIIDPQKNGWGVPLANDVDRGAMSKRHSDYGQPTLSRLARGESLEETYNLALETNRKRSVEVAGGAYISSLDNRNHWGGDSEDTPPRVIPRNESQGISQLDNDQEFQQELEKFTRKYGVSREDVYGIISGESAYNPAASNSFGYVGLFQLGGSALKDINRRNGTNITTTSVKNASPSEQLKVYDLYLQRWNYSNSSGLGIMQAAPAFASKPGNTEVYSVGSLAWQRNPAWRGPDGRITVDSINNYYKRKNPPALDSSGTLLADNEQNEQFINASYAPSTVSAPEKSTSWDEPSSGYMATYPYNRVIETPGGHVVELDSTQGNERIMVWHPSGSYMQMTKTTNTVKSTKDFYGIYDENHHISIGGKNFITIEGDSHVLVKGNKIEEIRGDYRQIVHGNIEVGAAGQIAINGGEETQIRSARLDLESNVENLNLKVGKKIVITSGEELHIKSKNVFIESTETTNILAGIDLNTKVTGDVNTDAARMFLQAAGALDVKGEHVKLGGGTKTSISSAIVAIDDIILLASGESVAPESIQAEAIASTEATEVEMEKPPARDLTFSDVPEKTESVIEGNSSQSQSPISENQTLGDSTFISRKTDGGALVKDSSGSIVSLNVGDLFPGSSLRVQNINSNTLTLGNGSDIQILKSIISGSDSSDV